MLSNNIWTPLKRCPIEENSLMNEWRNVSAKKTVPIGNEAFETIEHTAVYWLGGAGFLINSRGKIFLLDPVLLTQPNAPGVSEFGLKLKIDFPLSPDRIPRLDAVFYTHPDADHLGPLTALALAELRPKFVGTHTVFEKLVRLGVSHTLIEICRTGETAECSDILVEITPADHPWQLKNPFHGEHPYRMGDCCGYIFNTADGRLFFPGDTRLMEDHLRIRDIQLLALDVSLCEYHLGHTSAVLLANTLEEAVLIPQHYGTYDAPGKAAHVGDPSDVFQHIRNSDRRGKILAPGECIRLNEKNTMN
jgi:L-ascorbate metabolism protein UlaG (beta-lactamase superfamily)